VQVIDLELGDRVDVRLDLVQREEVPGHVEHHAAVLEPGPVGDRAAGQRDVTAAVDRHQLAHGLHGGEQPGRRVGSHLHTGRGDIQLVRLVAAVDLGQAQHDLAGRAAHRHGVPGGLPQGVGQEPGHRGIGGADPRTGSDRERRGRVRPHPRRHRDDIAKCLHGPDSKAS
jgi:hypothetical protein